MGAWVNGELRFHVPNVKQCLFSFGRRIASKNLFFMLPAFLAAPPRPTRMTFLLPPRNKCPNSQMSIQISSARASENRPWVNAHELGNSTRKNHFVDFLEVHGERYGMISDKQRAGYDAEGVYSLRMLKLSREFRRQVIGAFVRRVGLPEVACVSKGVLKGDAAVERKKTIKAMEEKKGLIVGGILGDEERRIWGRAPMLLRADLAKAFFGLEELEKGYIVVGMKRGNLELNQGAWLKKKCVDRLQVELWLCSMLLKQYSGVDVGTAVVVGLERLRTKPVAMGAFVGEDRALFDTEVWKWGKVNVGDSEGKLSVASIEALAWRVAVVDEGEEWIKAAMERTGGEGLLSLCKGSVDVKCRPNMKVQTLYDWPWAKAKRELAEELKDLTLVSGVSQDLVKGIVEKGIPSDYENEKVTALSLGGPNVVSNFTSKLLEMSKPSYAGPLVTPAAIRHNHFNWRRLQGFKESQSSSFNASYPELPFADERTFYIDFELASPSDLYNSVTMARVEEKEDVGEKGMHGDFFDVTPAGAIQEDGTYTSLIFMIGCGQVIKGEWKHRVFTARTLSQEGESAVVREWFEYMHSVIPADSGPPLLNAWGAEQYILQRSLRKMTATDKEAIQDIHSFKCVNVLQVVMKGQLAIKGCLSNSLKTVSKCLEEHGLLDDFQGRPGGALVSSGLDAMTVGLNSAEFVYMHGLGSLSEAPAMAQIVRYNEADCRDVARIVMFLRKHH